MRQRFTIAPASPDDLPRREPSLGAQPAPRHLVPREGGARAVQTTPRLELYAGERAVVVSSAGAANGGEGKAMLVKMGLAAMGLLALVGAASLLRPFVGL
jgi:hypothetical protein